MRKVIKDTAIMKIVGEFVDIEGTRNQLHTLWRGALAIPLKLRSLVYHILFTQEDLPDMAASMLVVFLLEIELCWQRNAEYQALPTLEKHNPRNEAVLAFCYTIGAYEAAISIVLPSTADPIQNFLRDAMVQSSRGYVINKLNAYERRLISPEITDRESRRRQANAGIIGCFRANLNISPPERESVFACRQAVEQITLDRFILTASDLSDIDAALSRAEVMVLVLTEMNQPIDHGDAEEAAPIVPQNQGENRATIDAVLDAISQDHHHGMGEAALDMGEIFTDNDESNEEERDEEDDDEDSVYYHSDYDSDDEIQPQTSRRTIKRRQKRKAKKLRERAQAKAKEEREKQEVASALHSLINAACAKVIEDKKTENEVAASLNGLLNSVCTKVIRDKAQEKAESDAADAILTDVLQSIAAEASKEKLNLHNAQQALLNARPTDIKPEFMLQFMTKFVPSIMRFARDDEGIDPLIGQCHVCLQPLNFTDRKPFYMRCCAQVLCPACVDNYMRAPRHPHPIEFDQKDPLVEQWVVLRKEMGLPVPRYDE
jgi:hypothetical protein